MSSEGSCQREAWKMFGAIEALRAHGFLPGLLSKAGRAVWEPQALVHLVKKKKQNVRVVIRNSLPFYLQLTAERARTKFWSSLAFSELISVSCYLLDGPVLPREEAAGF